MDINKYKTKEEKQKQRRLNFFYFKLGVNKNSPQEEINSKVLKFVNKKKNKINAIYNLPLSEIQKNDADFMLSFFKINPKLTGNNVYNPSEKLQSNVDFMIEYLKLEILRLIKRDEENKQSVNTPNYTFYQLQHLLHFNYKIVRQNPIFWEKLSTIYNDVNILKLLDDIFYERTIGTEKSKENTKNLILHLSEEFLIKQAEIYGYDMLRFLPEELKLNAKIIEAGVKKDGFKALEFLHISKVLENKKLIYEAYLMQGAYELGHYIFDTLSPVKTKYYGVDSYRTTYDKEYKNVQSELLKDTKIFNILQTYIIQQKIKELNCEIEYISSKKVLTLEECKILKEKKEQLDYEKSTIQKKCKIISFKTKTSPNDDKTF